MPTDDAIHAAFRRYSDAIRDRDREALSACFTDDVVQVDPYPSPANVGKDAVMAFFDQTWGMAEHLEFIPGRAIAGGDRGVFPFTIRSRLAGGTVIELDAIDVMTIAEDGRIAEITAYVDMAGMRPVAAD